MTSTRILIAAVIALTVSSCTWVEPDSAGSAVRVTYDKNLSGCDKRGEVTVSVKHEIAGIDRNAVKVQDELESLARNEAATLGADVVQALGPVEGGEQRYGAYRCG